MKKQKIEIKINKDVIDWNTEKHEIKMKFMVPVGKKSRKEAEKSIIELMSLYKKEINFDENLGTVSINGSTNIPSSKDIWIPKC